MGRRTRAAVTRVAGSGRRPSPNATAGGTTRRCGERHQQASSAAWNSAPYSGSRGRVLVAHQLHGPLPAGRRPPAASAEASAWSREAVDGRPPAGDTRGDGQHPRPEHAPPATTRSGARRRSRPWHSRGAARRPARPGPVTPARRRCATTSSPWRRSATCIGIEQGQLGGACPGGQRRRSSALTRAARCDRSWRALRRPPGDR